MNGLDDVPDAAYRAIFVGIVLYFALVVYAAVTDEVLAAYAAEFVFGVIAIGVGVVLFDQAERELSPILGAAVCLLAGGIAQFAFLFSRSEAFNQASSLLVFVGIGLYIYVTWTAE